MSILDKITVVIPSYKPDEKLISTLNGVLDAGFSDIIVVDDGGGDKHAHIFEEVKGMPHCTVIHHPVNRGKGAALKTAFAYYIENRADSIGLVTADADGQHLPKDILGCAEDMAESGSVVLGVRDFSQPHVPPRSKAGNRFTSGFFRLFFGMKISDTQTGLRAIPKEYVLPISKVDGDRYEYETHMLFLIGKSGIPLREHTIDTVYIDENKTSHFRVIHDSARIYKMVLLFSASALVCTVIDNLLFNVSFSTLEMALIPGVIAGTAIARLISSLLNYTANYTVVFKCKVNQLLSGTTLRYYLVAIPIMLVSMAAMIVLAAVGADYSNIWVFYAVRIVISLIFFPLSFRLQHNYVFNKYRNK